MKKNIEGQDKFCSNCEFSVPAPISENGDMFVCRKKGLVSWDSSCRKFIYDITKRDPKRPPEMPQVERIDLDD